MDIHVSTLGLTLLKHDFLPCSDMGSPVELLKMTFYHVTTSCRDMTTLSKILKKTIVGYVMTVDPTRSTGLQDLLLKEKEKMWVDFQVLKNPSSRRNDFALK